MAKEIYKNTKHIDNAPCDIFERDKNISLQEFLDENIESYWSERVKRVHHKELTKKYYQLQKDFKDNAEFYNDFFGREHYSHYQIKAISKTGKEYVWRKSTDKKWVLELYYQQLKKNYVKVQFIEYPPKIIFNNELNKWIKNPRTPIVYENEIVN